MRSPSTGTLIAFALPLGLLGALSFSTHAPSNRPWFLPDAAMLRHDPVAYGLIVAANLLLLLASARAIFRSFRK
jgi:hypothetical protein